MVAKNRQLFAGHIAPDTPPPPGAAGPAPMPSNPVSSSLSVAEDAYTCARPAGTAPPHYSPAGGARLFQAPEAGPSAAPGDGIKSHAR